MRKIICLLVLCTLGATRAAAADVLFTQSLAEKVAASPTVAIAAYMRAEGKPPFTNAHAPVAVFKVTRALRGCKIGDLLRIPDWGKRPPPEGHHKSPWPAQPPSAQEMRQWADGVVALPRPGAPFILLLGDEHRGLDSGSGHVWHPNHIDADPGSIATVAGLIAFSVELALVGSPRIDLGQPIILSLTVTNQGKSKAQLSLASLRMQTSHPKRGTLPWALPSPARAGSPPLLTIAPAAKESVQLDVNALFPSVFDVPGDYDVDFDLPAAGGPVGHGHFELVEYSQAYLCAKASHILRARVRVAGSGAAAVATLTDPVYLRLSGERLPSQLPWPTNAPPPTSERRIVCTNGSQVTFAGYDTPTTRRALGDLIEQDPPQWWSQSENADPRFRVSQQPGPASVQRKAEQERRLQELR